MGARLTPKQRRFVELYFETGNATEAYLQAYEPASMKRSTAAKEAWRLLRQNPRVAAVVEAVNKERERRLIERVCGGWTPAP